MTHVQRTRLLRTTLRLILGVLVALPARTATAQSVPTAPASVLQASPTLVPTESSAVGMNEMTTASVNPHTGAFHASIAFALPVARGAVQPGLSLNYSSSSSYGVGGYGWGLNLPAIERQTLWGPPTYTNSDTFVWAGRRLVEVNVAAEAGVAPPTFVTAGWHKYRLEVEDGTLIRFYTNFSEWIVSYGNGSRDEYGTNWGLGGQAVNTDANGNIFRWNLSARYDARRLPNVSEPNSPWGSFPTNLIAYVWTQMAPNPLAGGSTPIGYLTDVFDTPLVGTTKPTPASFAHHAHLTYGVQRLTSLQTQVWAAPPAFLLTGVNVTGMDYGNGGPTALSNPAAPPLTQRQQIHRYQLSYVTDSPANTEPPGTDNNLTALFEVNMQGVCPSNNPTEDPTSYLLPTTLAPCPAAPSDLFYPSITQPRSPVAMPDIQLPLPGGMPMLFDINNDSLPDVVMAPTPNQLNLSLTSLWLNYLSGAGPTATATFPPGSGDLNLPPYNASLDFLNGQPGQSSAWLPNFFVGPMQMDGRSRSRLDPFRPFSLLHRRRHGCARPATRDERLGAELGSDVPSKPQQRCVRNALREHRRQRRRNHGSLHARGGRIGERLRPFLLQYEQPGYLDVPHAAKYASQLPDRNRRLPSVPHWPGPERARYFRQRLHWRRGFW